MNVLPMRPRTAAIGGDMIEAEVGAAMRRAREEAGLDLAEAAARVNLDTGSMILSAALLRCWEAGAEVPDALQFLAVMRLPQREVALALLTGLLGLA